MQQSVDRSMRVFLFLFLTYICNKNILIVKCNRHKGFKEKTNITIGYLTVDQTESLTLGKQGRAISGAITYAIEQINQDSTLLPHHKLQLMWGDTMADTLIATRILTDQWRAGAKVFIGLEDRCTVEAKVAAAWNLPMISYVSLYLNPFPIKPLFLRVCNKSLLKTLWEKEKLLVRSNFFFSHSVFYQFGEFLLFLSNIKLSSANSLSLEESTICRF